MFISSNYSSLFVYFAILLYFGIEHSTCMILNFIFIIYIYIYTKILFFTWCQSDKCCWCWKWREGRRQKFLFSWNYCWIFVLLLFVIYINIFFCLYRGSIWKMSWSTFYRQLEWSWSSSAFVQIWKQPAAKRNGLLSRFLCNSWCTYVVSKFSLCLSINII